MHTGPENLIDCKCAANSPSSLWQHMCCKFTPHNGSGSKTHWAVMKPVLNMLFNATLGPLRLTPLNNKSVPAGSSLFFLALVTLVVGVRESGSQDDHRNAMWKGFTHGKQTHTHTHIHTSMQKTGHTLASSPMTCQKLIHLYLQRLARVTAMDYLTK